MEHIFKQQLEDNPPSFRTFSWCEGPSSDIRYYVNNIQKNDQERQRFLSAYDQTCKPFKSIRQHAKEIPNFGTFDDERSCRFFSNVKILKSTPMYFNEDILIECLIKLIKDWSIIVLNSYKGDKSKALKSIVFHKYEIDGVVGFNEQLTNGQRKVKRKQTFISLDVRWPLIFFENSIRFKDHAKSLQSTIEKFRILYLEWIRTTTKNPKVNLLIKVDMDIYEKGTYLIPSKPNDYITRLCDDTDHHYTIDDFTLAPKANYAEIIESIVVGRNPRIYSTELEELFPELVISKDCSSQTLVVTLDKETVTQDSPLAKKPRLSIEEQPDSFLGLPIYVITALKKATGYNDVVISSKGRSTNMWIIEVSNYDNTKCPHMKNHEKQKIFQTAISWKENSIKNCGYLKYQCWANGCDKKEWKFIGTIVTDKTTSRKKIIFSSEYIILRKDLQLQSVSFIENPKTEIVQQSTSNLTQSTSTLQTVETVEKKSEEEEEEIVNFDDENTISIFKKLDSSIFLLNGFNLDHLVELCTQKNDNGESALDYVVDYLAMNYRLNPMFLVRFGSKIGEWAQMTRDNLETFLEQCQVTIKTDDSSKKNSSQIVPLIKLWKRSKKCQRVENLFWYPNLKHRIPKQINEYVGFSYDCSPTKNKTVIQLKESTKAYFDHLFYAFAGGNEEYFYYLVAWFSHVLHEPWIKTDVAVLFISEQGIGKAALVNVLIKILTDEHYQETKNAQNFLKDQFNGSLQKKLLVFLDEFCGLEPGLLEEFKNMITSKNQTYNEKFEKKKSSKNYTNFLMAGNKKYRLIVERKDRRYAIFLCDEDHLKKRGLHHIDKKSREFYDPIFDVDVNDFLALTFWYHHHLKTNLTEHIPRTLILLEHQAHSLSIPIKWFLSLINDPESPPQNNWFGRTIERNTVFNHFVQQHPKESTKYGFFRELCELFGLQDTRPGTTERSRCLIFPHLRDIRNHFANNCFSYPLSNEEMDHVLGSLFD